MRTKILAVLFFLKATYAFPLNLEKQSDNKNAQLVSSPHPGKNDFSSAPQGPVKEIDYKNSQIVSSENIMDEPGKYEFSYETSDGQSRYETGYLANEGTKDEKFFVFGTFSYTGPDGKEYSVEYTADDTGFRPIGSHLPLAADVKNEEDSVGLPASAIGSLSGGGIG